MGACIRVNDDEDLRQAASFILMVRRKKEKEREGVGLQINRLRGFTTRHLWYRRTGRIRQTDRSDLYFTITIILHDNSIK